MSKCGKSFMPECEYHFITAGCISSFNCPYKIEHESNTTAISTPLNSNAIYADETYKDKEIARLIAKVAELRATLSKMETVEKELRERLDKAIELPCKVGDTVYWIEAYDNPQRIYEYKVEGFSMTQSKENLRVILDGRWLCPVIEVYKDVYLFFDRTKAEAKLKEQGGNN